MSAKIIALHALCITNYFRIFADRIRDKKTYV